MSESKSISLIVFTAILMLAGKVLVDEIRGFDSYRLYVMTALLIIGAGKGIWSVTQKQGVKFSEVVPNLVYVGLLDFAIIAIGLWLQSLFFDEDTIFFLILIIVAVYVVSNIVWEAVDKSTKKNGN